MAIINLYENFKKGKEYFDSSLMEAFEKTAGVRKEKVVFLSHKSSDKVIARKIAEALDGRGYGVYLDENDNFLQSAVNENKKEEVVNTIKEGIFNSHYLLCLISKDTKTSWWVPYEIGIADSNNKKIVSLLPKEFNNSVLPEFLEINEVLRHRADFMNYFKDIRDLNFERLYGNRYNYEIIFEKLEQVLD